MDVIPTEPMYIEETKPDGWVACKCGHHWVDPKRDPVLQHTEWEELREKDEKDT